MTRPTMDATWLRVACLLAQRSTCAKAAVGCVLADEFGRVLSTGYNGVARGQPHCNEAEEVPVYHNDPRVTYEPLGDEFVFRDQRTKAFERSWLRKRGNLQCVGHERKYLNTCPGAAAPRGSDLCEAVHAEANALLQCRDPDRVHTAYCSVSPCMRCAKELLNTGVKRVVYAQRYDAEPQAAALLERAGVTLIHLPQETS